MNRAVLNTITCKLEYVIFSRNINRKKKSQLFRLNAAADVGDKDVMILMTLILTVMNMLVIKSWILTFVWTMSETDIHRICLKRRTRYMLTGICAFLLALICFKQYFMSLYTYIHYSIWVSVDLFLFNDRKWLFNLIDLNWIGFGWLAYSGVIRCSRFSFTTKWWIQMHNKSCNRTWMVYVEEEDDNVIIGM